MRRKRKQNSNIKKKEKRLTDRPTTSIKQLITLIKLSDG